MEHGKEINWLNSVRHKELVTVGHTTFTISCFFKTKDKTHIWNMVFLFSKEILANFSIPCERI